MTEIDEAIIAIRSSETREAIIRKLIQEDEEFLRPVDFIDEVRTTADTSEGNFYQNLQKLCDQGLLEKKSGEGRATLYRPTELAERVVNQHPQAVKNYQARINEDPVSASGEDFYPGRAGVPGEV